MNQAACDAKRRVAGERPAAMPQGWGDLRAQSRTNDVDPRRALRARGRLNSASGWVKASVCDAQRRAQVNDLRLCRRAGEI